MQAKLSNLVSTDIQSNLFKHSVVSFPEKHSFITVKRNTNQSWGYNRPIRKTLLNVIHYCLWMIV